MDDLGFDVCFKGCQPQGWRSSNDGGEESRRRSGLLLGLILGLATLVLAGCGSTGPAPVGGWSGKGPVPKGYYLVRKGDSLSEIAAKRRVGTKNLIRWNALKPPYTVYAGKLLRVVAPGRSPGRSPGRARVGRARDVSKVTQPKSQTSSGTAAPAAPTPGSRTKGSGVAWAWPLSGAIVQGFRAGDPARQGLRISCRPGEEVRAAASGQVVYSGSGLKGYGNLIIVKHNKNYLSAYGFNRRLFIKEGDSVKRGQAVSECGEGPEGAYLLHFEVRRDGASVNPILYLPPRE
jgi:lipoprotein NlpD